MLTTQSAVPDPLLQPFIQWYLQREMIPNAAEAIEPVFPRAGAALIFQFASIYDVKEYGTEQLRRSWPATVVGPITARRVRLILRENMNSLDVLFRPSGLYRFFGVPIASLAGAGAEGHAFFGPKLSQLYERLGNAPDFTARVAILNRFFLHRLQRSDPLSPTASALNRLASGSVTVQAAANAIGISERHFERRSLELAGVSPRLLARIARFQRALSSHRSSPRTWLEIAHAAGYYDQMHLIRDFRDLAGAPPAQVASEIAPSDLIAFACR